MCVCVCVCVYIYIYISSLSLCRAANMDIPDPLSPSVSIVHHSPTDYFDIVAGVLQGDTLAPYLFIICLDYVF